MHEMNYLDPHNNVYVNLKFKRKFICKMLQTNCQICLPTLYDNSIVKCSNEKPVKRWSLWHAWSMIDQSVSKVKFLEEKGANDQDGHDNEANTLKEHWHNTSLNLDKGSGTWIVMNMRRSPLSYVLLESISNNRRWCLWYNIVLIVSRNLDTNLSKSTDR